MKLQASSVVVVLVVWLSGCFGSGEPDATGTPSMSGGAAAPANSNVMALDHAVLGSCSEIDAWVPIPVEMMGGLPHGLKAKAIDPVLQFTLVLYKFMQCGSSAMGSVAGPAVAASWVLVPVDPSPTKAIPGAQAHFWVPEMYGDNLQFLDAWEAVGAMVEAARVSVALADVAGSTKGHGQAKVEGPFEVSVQTVMSGTPSNLPERRWGIYTGHDNEYAGRTPLRLHLLEFHNATGYRDGLGVLRPSFTPSPVGDDAEPVPAAQSWGFELRLRFAWDERPEGARPSS